MSMFNVFDCLGRLLGGFKSLALSNRVVIGLSISRISFIVFSFLIVFEVGPFWLFKSDWFKLLNILLLSFSNGFVSTQCAIKAPTEVVESQQEQIGIFVGFFISIGILMGSIAAIGMGYLVPKNS